MKKYLKYYYYYEHKNYVRLRRVLKKEKKILKENNFLIIGFIVENTKENKIELKLIRILFIFKLVYLHMEELK